MPGIKRRTDKAYWFRDSHGLLYKAPIPVSWQGNAVYAYMIVLLIVAVLLENVIIGESAPTPGGTAATDKYYLAVFILIFAPWFYCILKKTDGSPNRFEKYKNNYHTRLFFIGCIGLLACLIILYAAVKG